MKKDNWENIPTVRHPLPTYKQMDATCDRYCPKFGGTNCKIDGDPIKEGDNCHFDYTQNQVLNLKK